MARMIEALSMAPASILDIEGGTLSPGSAADFIYFGPTVAGSLPVPISFRTRG